MTDRERLVHDLLNRLPGYTAAGLAGLLAREAYTCRICGARAIRRTSWVDADGAGFVRIECSDKPCPFVRTITDPEPRKSRTGKARKSVCVHNHD